MRAPSAARAWALALLLPCLSAGVIAAATVSGKFTIGDQTLTFENVAAFRMRDQFNPRAQETYVMVTARPVDLQAIAASIDPYAVAINDPAVRGDSDYLGFSVAADGTVAVNARFQGTQYIDSSGKIMGQQGSLVATCAENTATRIACKVKTAQPVKAMDGPTWSLDMTFAADVASRPAGKPLEKDGGAPAKALLALRSAIAGKDLAKILALLTPEQGEDYTKDWRSPAENLAAAKDLLDTRLPKKPKVTGGEMLADDRALLEVEGDAYEGRKMLYFVEMTLRDGKWLYQDSTIAGLLR